MAVLLLVMVVHRRDGAGARGSLPWLARQALESQALAYQLQTAGIASPAAAVHARPGGKIAGMKVRASPTSHGMHPADRATATFRFYEELNDFLPREQRKQDIAYCCARAATVKNAIEALGVPHTEVELILVNGESVNLSYLMREGDRVSVYPKFEALDIGPVLM